VSDLLSGTAYGGLFGNNRELVVKNTANVVEMVFGQKLTDVLVSLK
jgi:hypothetical protein